MKYLAIILLLFGCTREAKIKSALSGPGVSVQLLSYHPATASAPDSITAARLFSEFNRLSDEAKTLIRIGADLSLAPVKDSLSVLSGQIQAARARIEKAGGTPATYTVCRYVANSDTLTAVLDDRLNVVWPR